MSTRKGTDICEFVRHGFMYKNYIYIFVCVLQSVHWQGRDTCDFAQLEFIYKSIYHTLYVYFWMNVYIYKEVLSVGVREGRDICEFAQHRFISKSSDDIIHVYLWIYVCIQDHTRGSKCECVQGREHMRYMKCCIKMLYIWILWWFREVLTVRVRTRPGV